MKRRDFLKASVLFGLGSGLLPSGCWFTSTPKLEKKVLVLGIDGMDTHLTSHYMNQGVLPNFSKLAQKGSIRSMVTSLPPQSPVAWSNFIVGAPPSTHGIYDFIHRDPHTLKPYLSTSSVLPPEKTIDIGNWKLPLSKSQIKNLRKGKPFWEYLAKQDVPTTIFKVPANFPCLGKNVNMVSGMGTPDLRGGYGSFTLFTTAPQLFKKNISGGKVIPVSFRGQRLKTRLPGPVNTFKQNSPETSAAIEIWRDRQHPLVHVQIQNQRFLLQKGEWTGWVKLSFDMLDPFYDVEGICKLYVKSVHPDFTLYVSPINISPSNPALPVVTPQDYGEELVEKVGHFYTQGFPEDTKALSEGVFSDKEYLELGYQIIEERRNLLSYELKKFAREKTGMLFFYFSSLDQDTHMYWRTIDPAHPLYNEELHHQYGGTIRDIYIAMDQALGEVMEQFDINDPNFSLMVMSDHGFAPFRRQVHLNTWLFNNAYLGLLDAKHIENEGYFENVNWAKTSAYNVGINSIYLNLKGRERYGTIPINQRRRVLENIRSDLLKLVDVETKKRVVSNAWIVPEKEQAENPHAPDLMVGWNAGYRTSWKSILGGISEKTISDNLDKWSGDHCIDPNLVPALLVTNKRVTKKKPSLTDITATIVREFGIEPDAQMQGRSLYHI